MNERIKTLIKESGGHNIAYEGRPGSYSYAFTDTSVEKFAELIVQECIDIVEKDLVVNLTKAKTDNEGKIWTNAQLTFSQMIKWRFGVEE